MIGRTRKTAAVAVAVLTAFGAGIVVGEEVAYTTDDQDWSGFRPDTPTAPGVTNVTTLIDRSDGEHARCWATMESEGCTYWYP